MIPYNLFINLKILGRIQKNDRIRKSKNGVISLDNGVVCHFKRFLRNDNRKQSIQEIISILKDVDKFISLSDDTNDLSILNLELEKVKIGIENLKFTYMIDNSITSQIEICIVNIDTLITKISDKKNLL